VLPITLQSQFILFTKRELCLFTRRSSRCLGIEDKKGTLRPGAHADLVVLDKQGVVLSTWIRGKQAWARS
jgi:N-acetylglucosamine-6-phosphate deacetylase